MTNTLTSKAQTLAKEQANSLTRSDIESKYGFSKVYVERALSKGWLKGYKAPSRTNANVICWYVLQSDFEAWRKRADAHNNQAGNRLTIHANAEQQARLRKLLKEQGMESVLYTPVKIEQVVSK
jgi:hypothetical protein